MQPAQKTALREFLKASLSDKGDVAPLADDSSLFISGRLDSLAMTNLVMHLEKEFGIDFSNVNFDVDLVDSINDIERFVTEAG